MTAIKPGTADSMGRAGAKGASARLLFGGRTHGLSAAFAPSPAYETGLMITLSVKGRPAEASAGMMRVGGVLERPSGLPSRPGLPTVHEIDTSTDRYEHAED